MQLLATQEVIPLLQKPYISLHCITDTNNKDSTKSYGLGTHNASKGHN